MAEDSEGFGLEESHYTEQEMNLQSPSKKRKKSEKKKKQVPPVNAKIQVLGNQPDTTPPLVGYFPSGFNPYKDADEEAVEEQNSVKARVYRHKQKSNRMQLVVSPTGSNVDFVGTNYLGEATAGKQHCTYALGVFDKATQTLKIVPIASNMIFRLDPKVRGVDVSAKETPSVADGELSVKDKAERMRELTNLYGTKRSIKQAKKLHSLKQDEEDPDIKKDLEGKMKNVVVNKEALEGTNAQIARNIPTYNAAATTPQEAYPLDKIILRGEWGFLEDLYFLLQEGSKISENYPSFVRNRIYRLQHIQDEEEKKKLCSIFSYITHLIKYKDQHSMDGVSSAKGHKFPSMIRQKFSSMFSTTSKRMSPEKIGLLISHVAVLTLFVDEFSSDPSDIAKDLRISPFDLRLHFDNLGCKLVRKNNLSLFTLPIPLQFPELRQKRKRLNLRFLAKMMEFNFLFPIPKFRKAIAIKSAPYLAFSAPSRIPSALSGAVDGGGGGGGGGLSGYGGGSHG